MGTTPRSIQLLLHTATPDLADLIGHARFLERIRSVLLDILPAPAVAHVRVAAYEHYRLRLHASHAGWGTRLRYMQPAIAQALAQRMRLHIEAVEIKVRPERGAAPSPARPRHISATNRAHIEQMASYVSDPQLAGALARLARAGTESLGEPAPALRSEHEGLAFERVDNIEIGRTGGAKLETLGRQHATSIRSGRA